MNISIDKAKITVNDMLIDRGHKDIQYIGNYKIIADKKVLVFFSTEQKVSINNIKEFIIVLNDRKFEKGIFIYPQTITCSAKKAIDIVSHKNIELFELTELQYNITKHRLVPKHEKITGEEFNLINTKYGKNLPYILTSDPISRYYNFNKGDIVKIYRKSQHSQVIAYRIVV